MPPDGVIRDGLVAAKVAEIYLTSVYGKDQIEKQRPLVADLSGGIWTIRGTPPSKGRSFGGVAEIEIAKTDGRVLRMSHSL